MKWVRRLAIVGFYGLVAGIALNALIANFTTAMPGIVNVQASNEIQPSEFDIFLWNLWWVRHAIFDLHVSPLYTNYVVYPFLSPLAGHTLALLWGLVSAPFQMIFGLIPTFNAILVLSFVLAATAMYAFVRKHVERASVALLAGLLFAFTPAMVQRASVGHLDKLSIFWLPLCLLLWDKVDRDETLDVGRHRGAVRLSVVAHRFSADDVDAAAAGAIYALHPASDTLPLRERPG